MQIFMFLSSWGLFWNLSNSLMHKNPLATPTDRWQYFSPQEIRHGFDWSVAITDTEMSYFCFCFVGLCNRCKFRLHNPSPTPNHDPKNLSILSIFWVHFVPFQEGYSFFFCIGYKDLACPPFCRIMGGKLSPAKLTSLVLCGCVQPGVQKDKFM